MISLRRKITIPYICTIVSIPLFILILFNIALYYFSAKQAVTDLRNITNKTTQGFEFLDKRKIDRGKVMLLIRARNLSSSSELFLYTPQGESISPYSYVTNTSKNTAIKELLSQNSNTPISFSRKLFHESTAQSAYNAAKEERSGDIYTFWEKSKKYHAVKFSLVLQNTPMTALFISNGDFSYNFIYFANIILITVSAILVCVAIFISKYAVSSISRPIEYMTSIVGKAKKDSFITLENTSNIKELHVLSQKINAMSRAGYNYTQAQKNFFQNASHELRTPLTNIQGYAEGIEHGIFADAPKYAHTIGLEVKRLSNLVNDILSLSRIENSSFHTEYTQVSALKAVGNILQNTQQVAQKKSVKIELKSILDAEIYINEELFYQCVNNILSNALRYAKECISITVNVENDFVTITIADDGDGISPQDRPHIFEKFYKGKGGHFGLGLSIAKSAIECMHGTIFLKDTAHGTTFNILLPKNNLRIH